jgi:hypothetical protein
MAGKHRIGRVEDGRALGRHAGFAPNDFTHKNKRRPVRQADNRRIGRQCRVVHPANLQRPTRLRKASGRAYTCPTAGRQGARRRNVQSPVILSLSKDLTLNFPVILSLSKDLTLNFPVILSLSKDLALNFPVILSLSKDLALNFPVILSLSKDLTLNFLLDHRLNG